MRTLVVGAGASGAVVAARLSESSDHLVTLIEAGPDHPPGTALPADLADGGRNSMIHHDWGYRHRPTPAQRLVFQYPRGKVVGGSSAVNTCIALRGCPEDYDEWAALGLKEWSWDQCLPAFVRLERDLDFDDPWHGKDGPLPIRRHRPEELAEWQAAFLEGCALRGYPRCPDHNAPGSEGYGPHAMNKINGRRISAAEAWLTAAVRARPNLQLLADTLVRRVLFRGRRAVGVEIEHRGVTSRLEADRVVLCAGAVNTPGVLLRSGVGPRAELDRLGVERVADVPGVGARLLDHPGAAMFFLPRWGHVDRHAPVIQTLCRYTSEGSDFPVDMQFQPGSAFKLPRVDLPVVGVMTAVGKPSGVGTLRWPTANPHERPVIDVSILDHPDDLRKALEAMDRLWEICDTPPMRAVARPLWPRPSRIRDREWMSRWILTSCDSGYHPSGSVPMGTDDDPSAGTDGRGRVRGVEGLFVADASLMPTIPTANTHLPSLMIGERCGAWLRDG